MLVNEYRREQGGERVSVLAVMSTFYQLQQKINKIEKTVLRGLNKNWIDASCNILKQMQIMLWRLSDDEIMTGKEGMREW